MELLLREEARRALEIADILSIIRNYDPDQEQEITLAITWLNNLSWELRGLDVQIEAARGVISRSVADDLELVQTSVAFTLGDVWTILGKIPLNPTRAAYQDAWREINRYCLDMGKQALHMRLETYQLFLSALCRMVRSKSPSRTRMQDLREEIYDLQTLQRDNRRLISATEALSNLSMATLQPPGGPAPLQTQRPMSPTSSQENYETLHQPAAPSPPGVSSPTTTAGSILSSTASAEPRTPHWAATIFDNLPFTPFDDDPRPSCCFGDSAGRGRSFPDLEFERIFKIKFPGGLRVKLYCRARDHQCKIVCEWSESKKEPRRSCWALTDLHIRRSGPFLYLCRPTVVATSTCWASLKCTSYEWLVVFHCTFLSLRSHDGAKHVSNTLVLDHVLKGEMTEFSGAIRDSGYRHALRVYRDKSTDAVRLEASILDGDMRHTPIWTAFITHNITSPTWLRWLKNSSTVYLAELQRRVFSSQYTPHVAASGEHFLDFELTQDAAGFVETIEEIGTEYRRMKAE
ncbi:hypothetical protein ABEF95_001759 [Exophiala dermatitidis]